LFFCKARCAFLIPPPLVLVYKYCWFLVSALFSPLFVLNAPIFLSPLKKVQGPIPSSFSVFSPFFKSCPPKESRKDRQAGQSKNVQVSFSPPFFSPSPLPFCFIRGGFFFGSPFCPLDGEKRRPPWSFVQLPVLFPPPLYPTIDGP